ncbi:MAG TPA: UpxY family transcription antiterminator [Bryobacteraceae bacterium]|nr:UpxY family transcription antiterminator [Bryobacteraceae bacterium]
MQNTTEIAPCWYALSAKPRHEKAVAHHLETQKLESFLPLSSTFRRWSDRKKEVDLPLFCGYLFCRFGYRDRLRVLNTPGVLSIVGFARQDMPIDESEIEMVRRIVASGYRVGPWPYLHAGDRVRIKAGVLTGIEGILVREKTQARVVVNVELLQRSVSVEMDRDVLSHALIPNAASTAAMSFS